MQCLCQISGLPFEVSEGERILRERLALAGVPRISRPMRLRELCAFWPQFSLTKRKSDFSGKEVVSIFEETCHYPVWYREEWIENSNPPAAGYDFKRPFRITRQDLAFCQKNGIPLPNSYYVARLKENFSWMPFNGELRTGACCNCRSKIRTTWPERFDGQILCEKCYLERLQ